MSSDDLLREAKADKLEETLKSGDMSTLQDELVKLAQEDPQGFNKTIDLLKQKNDQDRAADPHLPSLEIRKEWFGLGNVEQIIVHGDKDKKTEIFETEQHHQTELQEDPESLLRTAKNFLESGRWTDKPDYQKDSSKRAVQTDNSIEYPSGEKWRDHRQNDEQVRTDLSPDELQKQINEGKY